jgi:NitT/TauT family transport system substrate-binding protein
LKRELVALCAIAAAVLSCSDRSEVKAPAKAPVRNIRIGYQPYLSSGPLFIALEDGFFEDEGLSVEALDVRTSEVIAALARGDIDATAQYINAASFAAMLKGVPIRFVADKGSPDPAGCIADGLVASLAMADRPVTPESLRGTRIALLKAAAGEYALDTYMATKGLDHTDYEQMYVQAQNSGEALASGSIDFRNTSEPELTNITKRGQGKVWLSQARMRPGLQHSTIMFGKRLTTEDRDIGMRFMRAYLRGIRRYNEGKTPANVAILAKYSKLSEDLVREACWTHVSDDGSLRTDAMTAFQTWAVSRGYLDRVVPVNEFADLQFQRDAAAGMRKH